MKGTGVLETFDKDDLEEVVPFTVSCAFSTGTKVYSYLANKGSVTKGDWVVTPTGFAEVTAVNTKSRNATKSVLGKLMIEKFTVDNNTEE